MESTSANIESLRVQLNFPLEQVKLPIIWHLAHDFGLRFSIHHANIDSRIGGFTDLELTGPRERIEAGLRWAQEQGVEVAALGITGADEWVI